MNVHLFGAVSSPGCANFGLHKTAQEGESEFGEDIANFLRNDFYVDDGLKSVKTKEDATHPTNHKPSVHEQAFVYTSSPATPSKFLKRCQSMTVLRR